MEKNLMNLEAYLFYSCVYIIYFIKGEGLCTRSWPTYILLWQWAGEAGGIYNNSRNLENDIFLEIKNSDQKERIPTAFNLLTQ